MFWLWVVGLKDSTHRWQVKQAIHRALPSPFHFQLDLDCTKLWCGVTSAPEPKELHYQPTVEEIFTELERQINQNLEIPPEAQQTGMPIIFPLTDGEQEEEREVSLYTVPFFEDLQALTIVPPNPSPGKRKQLNKKNKGKKVVEEEALEIDTEEIWRETFQSNEGIDFNDPIIKEKMTSITSKIIVKLQQTRQETATMKKIYSSSVRPQMKEAFQKVKNIKSTLRKIETRGEKRQNNLERTTTFVSPTKVTVNMTEWELRPKVTPSKKRTLDVAIDLTRESPPAEPVPIIEEFPAKKKKRKLIINESSEATESDQPVEMDDIEIETIDMEQQESVEEIDTELVQQQSTRKPHVTTTFS
jgi:hypothetical protein